MGGSCSGIDGLAEALERRLTGDADDVADLLPGTAELTCGASRGTEQFLCATT